MSDGEKKIKVEGILGAYMYIEAVGQARWRGWGILRGREAREGQRWPERGQRGRPEGCQSHERGRRLLP